MQQLEIDDFARPLLQLEALCRKRPLTERIRREIQALMLETGIRTIRVGAVIFEAVPRKALSVTPMAQQQKRTFVQRARRRWLQARMWWEFWCFRSAKAEARWMQRNGHDDESEEAWERAQRHRGSFKALRASRGAA